MNILHSLTAVGLYTRFAVSVLGWQLGQGITHDLLPCSPRLLQAVLGGGGRGGYWGVWGRGVGESNKPVIESCCTRPISEAFQISAGD